MKTEFVNLLKQNIGKTVEGHVAGFGAWLNGRIKSVTDEGNIELDFEVREEMLNPMGTMHGGALAAIIDEILGMQLFAKSDEGATYLAINIQVDFIKAVRVGETLTAIPEVVRIGRRAANVACVLVNSKGVVISRGSSNFMKMT
ncbi:MAG: PaaI family thioesterase [Aureispira sp.]|nr:PaaI family thioesterase [Aureispira sp.]